MNSIQKGSVPLGSKKKGRPQAAGFG